MANEVLVIKASEWNRGGHGRLMDPGTRTYCCLGLEARRCGFTDAQLWDVSTPVALSYDIPVADHPYFKRWALGSGGTASAMAINDDPRLTDEERIERLRPIFASAGITIDWRPDE